MEDENRIIRDRYAKSVVVMNFTGVYDYESVALFGIEKLRFPMQPTELQVLCTSLLTS